jgi:hypothetical protein
LFATCGRSSHPLPHKAVSHLVKSIGKNLLPNTGVPIVKKTEQEEISGLVEAVALKAWIRSYTKIPTQA